MAIKSNMTTPALELSYIYTTLNSIFQGRNNYPTMLTKMYQLKLTNSNDSEGDNGKSLPLWSIFS